MLCCGECIYIEAWVGYQTIGRTSIWLVFARSFSLRFALLDWGSFNSEACGDERAGAALHMAAVVMKRTAVAIEDPEMRASFLNNVPVNRQLQAALAKHGQSLRWSG